MALIRILFALLVLTLPASAQQKVALVIGNASYANATPLANPLNDARAVAEKLRGIGFDVALYDDLDGQAFRVALGAFSEKALNADLAVVFYAGHAIEMEGKNYLIPIDAEMKSEATAQFETITLDQMLQAVRGANQLGLVMLDACRNNPFATTMLRSNGTRAVTRGLAAISVEGESGLLVSFAAEAGNTADDGQGDHSPYTLALLTVLDQPGLEVGRMFRSVRAKVKEATAGRQVPIEQMQLPDSDIYLVSGAVNTHATTSDPAPVVVNAPPPKDDPTVAYFAAVKAGTPEALADFLQRYPGHAKAAAAQALMESMEDDAFWQATTTAGTVAAYRRYLLVFPAGTYAGQAEDWLILAMPADPGSEPDPAPDQGLIQPVNARPSFDCADARTESELAICASAELAQQDHQMVAVFKQAITNGQTTKSQQREWVAYRDQICVGNGAAQCVYQVTNERIIALGG